MCSPTIAIAATAISSTVSAIGAIQQGEAQQRYYNAVAEQNEEQARIAQQTAARQSAYIQDQASRESSKVSEQGKQLAGAQKVAWAGSGLNSASSSAEDIALDTQTKVERDQMAIRYNADKNSYETTEQGKYESWALKEQAKQGRVAGQMARQAGYINATSSLLSGATSAANTWYLWKGKK